MATACTHTSPHLTSKSWPRTRTRAPGPSSFEMIDGMLYRRKLEKGFINYREVLDEERRHEAVSSFHRRRAGQRHLSLEETYKCVAENYWWDGMYFQIRDVVLGCTECRNQKRKKFQEQGVGACVTKRLTSHGSEVLSRLKSQREAGMFCDITLRTSGRSYSAHKAVLAAVSDHFQEVFTEMDAGGTADMDLTGFSERSLLPLLDFSYSSTLKVRPEDLPEVVTMARHLGMWQAVEACSALMKEQDSEQDLACQERHQSKRKRAAGADKDPPGEALELSPRRTLRRLSSPPPPLSPSHRMKLLDFKSPSLKKEASPSPISPPNTRLLRSSPRAAATPPSPLSPPLSPPITRLLRSSPRAAQRVHQTAPQSPRLQKKPHPISELTRSPARVKQEEVVLDDELDHARALEKYRLMNVLGLQRTALLPRPEDLIGWRQKKRLRKLKANNYSLTKRRKPLPADPRGPGAPPNCAPTKSKPASPLKPEPRRKSVALKVPPCDRSMRSRGVLPDLFQLVSRAGYGARELRRSVRRGDRRLVKQHVRRKPHRATSRTAVRVKAEPAHVAVSPLASQEALKAPRYNSSRPTSKSRARPGGTPEAHKSAGAGLKVGDPEHTHPIYEHPLYKVIKEEPADPLPVGGAFLDPPSPDLGKRQSKPPIKLLDSGFLFSFCRPPLAGLKKEEESVDICLTRSVSQGGAGAFPSNHRTLRTRVPALKQETEERGLNPNVTARAKASDGARSRPSGPTNAWTTPPKGSPRPAGRAHLVLDSVRRARLKQLRGPRSQVPTASKSAHSCLQCPASCRDCDALIMHRLRHIEGKHWPCLLCSKTFFRLGNVRNHIRTHDPKLYKCRSCMLAGS